jgi:hypothetical protein
MHGKQEGGWTRNAYLLLGQRVHCTEGPQARSEGLKPDTVLAKRCS